MYDRGRVEFDRREVVDFWSKTMGEHSGFIAHLLDPDERLLIDQASKMERAFLQTGFRDVRGDDAMKAAREILDFKPPLASHVRREAVRFIDELQRTQAG